MLWIRKSVWFLTSVPLSTIWVTMVPTLFWVSDRSWKMVCLWTFPNALSWWILKPKRWSVPSLFSTPSEMRKNGTFWRIPSKRPSWETISHPKASNFSGKSSNRATYNKMPGFFMCTFVVRIATLTNMNALKWVLMFGFFILNLFINYVIMKLLSTIKKEAPNECINIICFYFLYAFIRRSSNICLGFIPKQEVYSCNCFINYYSFSYNLWSALVSWLFNNIFILYV